MPRGYHKGSVEQLKKCWIELISFALTLFISSVFETVELKRLNGGFQYQNNPGLCGPGFPNLEACNAEYDPNKPEPLGPNTLLKKNFPQSVNLTKHDCQKRSCRNRSRGRHTGLAFGGIAVTVAFIIAGISAFTLYRRRKQKIGGTPEGLESR